MLLFVSLIPCRGCVKRASAAARCTGAARRWSLVLLRCFAMHYCMNFGAQSTATGQQCLGLRPKTGRRGAWLNVGGIFCGPIFVAGGCPGGRQCSRHCSYLRCRLTVVRGRGPAEQVPQLLACSGRRFPTTATLRTQALRRQGLLGIRCLVCHATLGRLRVGSSLACFCRALLDNCTSCVA